MAYAPIALFTYSRADHTRRAVESLLLNNEAAESDLYIFSDGPKNESKIQGVRETREYIHTISGFRSVTIIERENNWGLSKSLISGISEVVGKYGRVIVVEDDLVLSPYFLKFMNDGLTMYQDDDRVGAISGYVFQDDNRLPETYFLRFFNCWGWAIWKRSWDILIIDTRFLLRKMRFRKAEFDVGGYAGAYGNLYCTKVGIVDSWWVRLYASLFLAGKLTLYPNVSLVENGGNDGTGTHCQDTGKSNGHKLSHSSINVQRTQIIENKYAYKSLSHYFESTRSDGKRIHILPRIKSYIRRLFYIDCI